MFKLNFKKSKSIKKPINILKNQHQQLEITKISFDKNTFKSILRRTMYPSLVVTLI